MQSGDPLDNPQISSQKIAVMSIEKHIAKKKTFDMC